MQRSDRRRWWSSVAVFAALTWSLVVPSAAAATVVDLATAPSCPVSLSAQWQPFGMPYPCYPQGTVYELTTPVFDAPTVVQLNGVAVGVADGSTLTLPVAAVGLNVIEYLRTDADGMARTVGTPLRFINYRQLLRLFSVAATERKAPFALTLQAGTDVAALFQAVGVAANEWRTQQLSSPGGDPVYVVDLDGTQLQTLHADPSVVTLVPEKIIASATDQANPPWGLDRIDQETSTLNATYSYSYTGVGVDVFVVDSGIRTTHNEFTGRLGLGAKLNTFTSIEDCNGHGTHVSGIVGGTTYGVAKGVTIRPVRVFDCNGSSTTSAITAAINWIIAQHVETQSAVANFSLGGAVDPGLNAAIEALISDGVVAVVAAGNETADACNYSPASATNAITVAASNSNDTFAWYSNYGSCVDIIAPGSSILSAGITSDTATLTLSGTSMATPHVAGVAALILQRDFATYSNKRQANALVLQTMIADSVKDVIKAPVPSGTPNRLVSTRNLQALNQQALSLTLTDTDTVAGVALALAATGGSGTGTVTYARVSGDCQVQDNYLSAWTATNCVVTSTKAGSVVDTVTYAAATSAAETFTVTTRVNDGSWVQVDTGHDFTCAVSTTKRVYCWGTNSQGQLARPIGTGASGGSNVIDTGTANQIHPQPLLVTELVGDVESVSTGYAHACARMTTGKVFCWGDNTYGQLGDSSTVSATAPVEVLLPETATAVSAGDASTCAVLTSGAIACWGLGADGRLGTGNTSTALRPVVISGVSHAVDVSVGSRHTCALANGKAYCWGYGTTGALGLGDTRTVSTAETVTALSNVARISAGNDNSCAVLTNGDTYCWGSNASGALGLGTQTQTETPTAIVTGLADTSTVIAVGDGATCGVNTSGAAYCMGANADGQLGTGDAATATSAQQVRGLASGVVAIAPPSSGHGCAIVSGGALYCWGRNDYGQLGSGNTLSWTFMSAATQLAIEPALVPEYETGTARTNGFTLLMTNYDSAFAYAVTVAPDTATVTRTAGTIAVTGLQQGETATVSVMTSRIGFLTETTTTTGMASYDGLTPTLETITATADGFTAQITNYDPLYSWSASSVGGETATVNASGLVTVSGLAAATTDTVTVTSSRNGFTSETATATGTSLLAALVPAFGTVNKTSTGFSVSITNYDTAFAWTSVLVSPPAGASLSVNADALTVTGLAAGESATIRVTTTRSGHADGTADYTSSASPATTTNTGDGGGGGGGGGGAAPATVTPAASGGGGGGASQIIQSGQTLTVDPTSSAVALTLQSPTVADMVLTIPIAAVPEGSKVAMTSVPRAVDQPIGVSAVRVVINDPSGRAITSFTTPLELKLGKPESGTVVATSADGETWTVIPRMDTDTLAAGQRDGFRIAADGQAIVFTRHLTYFGFRAAQPALQVSAPESITVGASAAATVVGGAGSGTVQWSTSTSEICSVDSAGTVAAKAVGNCSVLVRRLGDRTYAASDPVTASITIAAAVVVPPTPVVVKPSGTLLRVTSIGDRRVIKVTLGTAYASTSVRLQRSTLATSGFKTMAVLRLNAAGIASTTRSLRAGTYVRLVLNNTVLTKLRLR